MMETTAAYNISIS